MTNRFKIEKLEERIAPSFPGNPPDFADQWHGFGSDHQAGNSPGDTASARHNFADATAGNSGHNPTAGSNG